MLFFTNLFDTFTVLKITDQESHCLYFLQVPIVILIISSHQIWFLVENIVMFDAVFQSHY